MLTYIGTLSCINSFVYAIALFYPSNDCTVKEEHKVQKMIKLSVQQAAAKQPVPHSRLRSV
jgi:hypothetical protein